MNNERQQELERLEKELLKDIPADDDLLADIPRCLWESTPSAPVEEVIPEPAFDSEDFDIDLDLNFDEEEPQEEPQEDTRTGTWMPSSSTSSSSTSSTR